MSHSTDSSALDPIISLRTGSANISQSVGIPAFLKFLCKQHLLDSFLEVFNKYAPRCKPHFQYDNLDMLKTLAVMHAKGEPDFNDAEELRADGLIARVLSAASAPTMSRFFARLERTCIADRERKLNKAEVELKQCEKTHALRICSALTDDLNAALLSNAIDALKSTKPKFITIDVDSTPVPTYGSQGESAYDAHYGIKGYLPIFVTLNGFPALLQNAPGAAYGAKLFMLHAENILTKLKEAFPKATLIVRADTGFAHQPLIDLIQKLGHRFIIGCNYRGGADIQPEAYRILHEYVVKNWDSGKLPQVLANFYELQTGEYDPTKDPDAEKVRVCGVLKDYKMKSWSFARTVVFRLQIDPNFQNPNMRFVQTNLTEEELHAYTSGRGRRKDRAIDSKCFAECCEDVDFAVELYEAAFADRGMDERQNQEWKTQCCGHRVSCEGFFANTVRMQIATLVYQLLERFRRTLLPVIQKPSPMWHRKSCKGNHTSPHQAEKALCGPTIDSIRKFLINRAGHVTFKQTGAIEIVVGYLPPRWATAMKTLMAI